MSVRARLLVTVCAVALLSACVAVSAVAAGPAGSDAAASAKPKKGKGAKKGCKKGFKKQTVIKKGKKVKVCKKVKGKQAPAEGGGGAGGPASLFEAPGKQLTGEAAIPFLQKYLANSSWTTCTAGWPQCPGSVEERYSHHADSSFYYCRLTSVSGADILVSDSYTVVAAQIEPDGSWIFREVVSNSGNNSVYEWKVSTTGLVEGAYQFQPSSPIQKLGPFQYVAGPRNCSY